MKRAVACLSGGMDSTGLLMRLLAEDYFVTGISFDYGQKHKLELERLRQNLDYLDVMSLRSGIENLKVEHHVVSLRADGLPLGTILHSALCTEGWRPPEGHYEADNMKETVVPNRNAIFSGIAYAIALSIATKSRESVRLALGVHSGDHEIYPDCRPEFYDKLLAAFQSGNWDSERVELFLPYLDGDKETILKDADAAIDKLNDVWTQGASDAERAANRIEFDRIFANTNTSYSPDSQGRASGKTGADVERILAFHAIGRRDPIEYVDGWDSALANALELQEKNKCAHVWEEMYNGDKICFECDELKPNE